MRRLVRGTSNALDVIEALGYVAAFFLLLGLLLTGHIPRDLELWFGAVLGGLVLFVVGAVTFKRWTRRKSVP
jgi:Na+/H+ antiporter NhaD/arsenite permease-like protein